MTTYTIAYIGRSLVATAPDDEDIAEAVRTTAEADHEDFDISECETETGPILTDFPEDDDEIVWTSGGSTGQLSDGSTTFQYAVRREEVA